MRPTPTPWYLAPEALTLLASLRADPPRCVRHVEHHILTRDEWTAYAGGRVDALDRLHKARLSDLDASGADRKTIREHLAADTQRVINAALHDYPVPLFTYVKDEIDAMGGLIEAALAVGAQASERVAA